MKKWVIKNNNIKTAEKLSAGSDLSLFCSEILVSRGISELDRASDFFIPSTPENPFMMKDMREAVEILNEAVDNEKKICIYGDYDCDGIVSTVMLFSYLQCIGGNVSYYIPEREEGYGMNENSVRKIAEEGTDVIITVDNGIAAVKEAELIKQLGMTLVITDHHQVGEEMPYAAAVLNPHRPDCPSRFKELCGAGVVLKLISAIEGGDYECIMEQFGDIAALATIADIVSLTGENRYIVSRGLDILGNTERCGLIALMEKCGLKSDELKSVSVAFSIIPRINASGRFGSPRLAANLLMCEDIQQAEEMAEQLNNLNNQRKDCENEIIENIKQFIVNNPESIKKRVLVFSGDNWHHGVIGIVSARISEHFGKPCFIITKENGGMSRGSARSFGNFSVFKCLEYCKDLLVKFGGHMGAGGFSLQTDDIENFDKTVQEYARINHDVMPVFSIVADKFIKPDEITVENIKSLDIFEPFGENNPEPLFLINNARVENIIPLSGGLHTKLVLRYGQLLLDALMFRMPAASLGIKTGEIWSFIVSFSINTYKGKSSVSATVKDFRKYGVKQERYFHFSSLYEKYSLGEISDKNIISEICPSKSELTLVYKHLGNVPQNLNNLYSMLEPQGINLCKLRICIDVFCELGLAECNVYDEIINRIPVNSKVNLDDSEILRRLKDSL